LYPIVITKKERKRKLRVIALILCLVLTLAFGVSFANDYDEYTNVVRKYYENKQTDEDVVNNWKAGLLEQYQANLDHLLMTFEFVKGIETTDGRILITGVLTITAYCIKDGDKIRITQLAAMAILMSKDKKIEKKVRIKEADQHIIEAGWYGSPV
jgi:hypothetical protein